MAYTYLIGWSNLNKYYYGVRFAKDCHPDELWVSYYTSSKHVHYFYEKHGEPDIIQIRKIFDNIQSARLWEHKVLRRMNVVDSHIWLNMTDNISISLEASNNTGRKYNVDRSGANNPMFGKKHSAETLQKMRGVKSEEAKQNMRGKRTHVNQKGINNNNFKGFFITPWGTFASSASAAKHAPYNINKNSINNWCKNYSKIAQKSKYAMY